ncbi:Gpi-anchored leucine-rich lipoprotein [Globisporangium polare]
MWKLSAVATLLCALSLASAASSGYRPGDETCVLSETNQCTADSITPSALDGSVLIYPGGKTRCAFDDFKDPKGVFNTNSTFFFQVFPTKQQDKAKLLLVFQGGGACIDADTCSFSLQCALGTGTFNPNADPVSTGVMNRTNPSNLFKDWNIVHVPYCTGDLHVGNAVHSASDGIYATILGQNQCLGQNQSTHMVGYENSISALKWAAANYPNPEHLIVGGASAGSLAAQALSVYVADMWQVKERSIRYSVVGDSYVGVFPEDKRSAGSVVDFYGACDVELKAPADIMDACRNKTMSVTQLMAALLREVPFSDWLFIDSKADQAQRYFYQLMKDGILGYPFKNLISGEDFFKQVTTMVTAYKTVSSRISTFFVEGEKHVFTAYDDYTSAVSDTGVPLGAFLAEWLLPHNTSSSSASNATANATAAPATAPPASSAPSKLPSGGIAALIAVAVVTFSG